jgi:chromate transporter
MMAEDTGRRNPTHSQAPSVSELLLALSSISLSGFGGVLPWARRVIVEQRAWMTAAEFNEALALCQLLPGANIVNFSIMFGSRARGLPGALVSFAGLIGPPVIIVLVLAVLYDHIGDLEAVRRVLTGMAAAAAGLIIATASKMARPPLHRRSWPAALAALAALMLVGVVGCPLPVALFGLVPVSISLAWWTRR